jgi:histidinol-phosphate aminotransferase
MVIHPKARPIFSQLTIPGNVKKHLNPPDIQIDLGNSTNPYIGEWSEYPDLNSRRLKELFLDIIYAINPPIGFEDHHHHLISPENLLFTVGSMEGIDLILRSFAEPNNDSILVTDPSFPAYEHWGRLQNLNILKIPLTGEHFQYLDVESILNLNPKLIFLCEPNNPTGTMLERHIIDELCQKCTGLVVVDEAYIEFSDHPSLIYDWHKYKDKLIIVRTLSKAWGMAAARCGIVIADELIINTLRYIQVPFGFSTPSQIEVFERFLYPDEMIATWGRIKSERNILIEYVMQLRCVEKVFRSHSNFIMIILKNFKQVMKLLQEKKIFVLNCSDAIPNSIRVSLSSRENNLKFLDVLKQSCENL